MENGFRACPDYDDYPEQQLDQSYSYSSFGSLRDTNTEFKSLRKTNYALAYCGLPTRTVIPTRASGSLVNQGNVSPGVAFQLVSNTQRIFSYKHSLIFAGNKSSVNDASLRRGAHSLFEYIPNKGQPDTTGSNPAYLSELPNSSFLFDSDNAGAGGSRSVSLCLLDSYIYALYNSNFAIACGDVLTTLFCRYNLEARTGWEYIPCSPVNSPAGSRSNTSLHAVNGCLYVFGGYSYNNIALEDVWKCYPSNGHVWDKLTTSWATSLTHNGTYAGGASCCVGSKIIFTPTNPATHLLIYDTVSGDVSTIQTSTLQTYGLTAVNNTLYMLTTAGLLVASLSCYKTSSITTTSAVAAAANGRADIVYSTHYDALFALRFYNSGNYDPVISIIKVAA